MSASTQLPSQAHYSAIPKGKKRLKDEPNNKPCPPDKMKLDKDLAVNLKSIREKEACLKFISWNDTHEITAELTKMTSKLSDINSKKKVNCDEVGRIEEEIKNLGAEVIRKRDEASKLVAGVRHKTEGRIDEAVSKLEEQLKIYKYSVTEERKLQHEIDTLKKSKDRLRDYLQMKSDVDQMRIKQDQLRKARDTLYRSNTDLRERETSLKDEIDEKRAMKEQYIEDRKKAMARKDSIEKEIRELQQQKKQLYDTYYQQRFVYSQVMAEEREQRKLEEKQSEDRKATRRARHRKDAIDPDITRELNYDEEKAVCRALVDYVTKLSFSSLPNASAGSPSSSNDRPLLLNASATAISSDMPGEFLKRKGDLDNTDVLVRATSKRKSKRDKKKQTVSSKPGKLLRHNATTVKHFGFIGLAPPTSQFEIPNVLAQVQEKLTFYESKSRSGLVGGSEAGDSGVGSFACSEFHDFSDPEFITPLTTSQEDVPSTAKFIISPRRSLTDSEISPHIPDPISNLTLTSYPIFHRDQSISSHLSSVSLVTQSSTSTSSNSILMATAGGNEE